MTRFLMTLEDSTDLVLHALKNGSAGDIFVQKAPSCKVIDLGQALCNLLGVTFNYKFIGIRHGEKLSETLISAEEMLNVNEKGNFYIIKPDNRNINY